MGSAVVCAVGWRWSVTVGARMLSLSLGGHKPSLLPREAALRFGEIEAVEAHDFLPRLVAAEQRHRAT
jgi:hypothetical protein